MEERAVPNIPPHRSVVHASFDQAIEARVAEALLYNMDPARTALVPCEIIGLSSYPGNAPTAQILVEGSFVFSDVPLHLLFNKRLVAPPENPLGLEILVHDKCPDGAIDLSFNPHLARDKCSVYFSRMETAKDEERWMSGTYRVTVDWFRDNLCAHLVSLDNGQFALQPQAKISFNGGPRKLPDYRRLECGWWVK